MVAVVVGAQVFGGGEAGATPVTADGRQIDGWGRGPTGEPEKQWRERMDCASVCSVAADGGRAFLLSAPDSYEDDRELVALDAGSGDERWSVDTEGDTVQLVGSSLLVSTYGSPSTVQSYDPATGDRRWEADGVWSGYTAGDLVVLYSYEDGADVGDISVVGLGDGKERWSTEGSPTGLCHGAVFASDSRSVSAYDLGSGDRRWRERIDGDTSVGCDEQSVYAVEDGEVRSLDMDSGEDGWTERLRGATSVQTAKGVVVVTAGSEVIGLDPADGTELWSEDDLGVGFVEVGDGRAVFQVPDEVGRTTLFDLADGEPVGTERGTDLAAVGPKLSVLTDDDDLLAFDHDRFDRRWSLDVDGSIGQAVMADGTLYVVDDRSLTAYR